MRIIPKLLACSAGMALVWASQAFAAGPYPPTDWPTSIDTTKVVHYVVADGTLPPPAGAVNWTNSLGFIASTPGSDQYLQSCCAANLGCYRALSSYINLADTNYITWNTNDTVDILLLVYGDVSMLNPYNLKQTRAWTFRIGTTAPIETGTTVNAAAIATNSYNLSWNWILLSTTNKLINDGSGNRYIGSIPTGSGSGSEYSGVNHGTIRFGASSAANFLNGIAIRAVAFGEKGAFGTTNDINVYAPMNTTCPPVPVANLASIDFNAGLTNHLQVMAGADDSATYMTDIGPAGDKRKAIQANGSLLNFGITDNYLGVACNENTIVKVCVDFFDDPLFAGYNVRFGPEAYAVCPVAGSQAAIYDSSKLASLTGSGQWIRRSWMIPNVNLAGINTAPLTGGPRLISTSDVGGVPVPVSRFELGILRTGFDPLAGLDPLPDCYQDPLMCQGVYGTYVELDLQHGITNGLDVGTGGADQGFLTSTVGPADDQRFSVYGTNAPNYYLQFQILTNGYPLGPTSQGNLRMAIALTYYDDPAAVGVGFRPQVWHYQFAGLELLGFLDQPYNVVLQGTDRWREAYWEIPMIDLSGVNQGRQAAARFQIDGAKPIHVCRVRYTAIRPCGPLANVNPMAPSFTLSAAPETNSLVRLSWFYQAPQLLLQGKPTFDAPWTPFPGMPVGEGTNAVLRFSPTNADSQFFRLLMP